MFSSRISYQVAALFCRSFSTLLHSGVNILTAIEVAADKGLDPKLKKIGKEIQTELRQGNDISSALKLQGDYFPELMIEMIHVAEQTGTLPEVLAALSDHYENIVRLRKLFIQSITWPVIQLFAAIFIIAGLILVLGMIAGSGPAIDPLGFGLTGGKGALAWLALCFGSMFSLFVIIQLVRGFGKEQMLHGFLLQLPAIGHCLQSFAVARFSWAFALTQQAGMDVLPSLESSFSATGNKAYTAKTPQVLAMVREGVELTPALESTKLFPRDFLEMVRVGETSGTVPELLQRMSPDFEDQARRSMSRLTGVLSGFVWLCVATMIIFLIFKIMFWYMGMLNNALEGKF